MQQDPWAVEHFSRAISSLACAQLLKPHCPSPVRNCFRSGRGGLSLGSFMGHQAGQGCATMQEAVVVVVKSGTSKVPNLMVLLRYLQLSAVRHSFPFTSLSVQLKRSH